MDPLPDRTSERIVGLDGIRGLAVSMVVAWHYLPCQLERDLGLWASAVRRLLYLTGTGVDLFFVLSGFLITGILLDQRGAVNYLKVFYLRRACRIFPVYFLLVACYVVLSATLKIPEAGREWMFSHAMPLWSYVTFTQNILMGIEGHFGAGMLAVTWSLAVEEQFYLAMPLLVLVAGRRGLVWLVPALLVAIPALRFLSPGFHAYVNTPWRADSLLAGAAVALLVRSEAGLAAIRAAKAKLGMLGALLAAVVPLVVIWPGVLGPFYHSWLAASYALLVLAVVSGLWPGLGIVLRGRAIVWLGQYSYGIYMYHQTVSGVLHGLIRGQAPAIGGISDACVTAGAGLLTLLLAWLSYRLMESRLIAFGHRFRYLHPATCAPPTPSPEHR